MISLDHKTQTSTSSSPLNTLPSEEGESSGLSFSELLRGVSSKKDESTIQNGAFIVALDEETTHTKSSKNGALLALLKGEAQEELAALELNPAALKDLDAKELKALIKDAKNYLKDKILASDGFKKAEIDTLPKTLKGLTQVAQKLGIDVSKITIEEVQVSTKSTDKLALSLESSKFSSDQDLKEPKEKVLKGSSEVETSLETEPKLKTKRATTLQNKQDLEDVDAQQRVDKKLGDAPKEIKATPLFKAQNTQEITTEQLVNTKLSTLEVKTPKQKADETLKMLLRGEKVSKKESGFTADFSVATARVIAPTATTETSKTLESLLHGDKQESTALKVDGLNVNKADSFEVKLNEAKQMTKYLSQDVKTAIEDYKSPFTRIKVALNPQKLGAVELTVVQRGKNLHINLSSNNAAINTLAMNVNDLKVQLTNNGINNASFNFNSSSQGSEQGSQSQHQQSQKDQEADREYNYFDNEEKNEEVLTSLEIVVPHYA